MAELAHRFAIIANQGSGAWTGEARQQIECACKRANLDAQIHAVAGSELHATAARAAADGAMALVAVGGDGTVSTVAAVACEARRLFGVIPLGTLNHFARDTGIPLTVDQAVNTLATGRHVALDVGVANGRTFLNNMSLGFYVRIVRERIAEQRRGHRKWIGFVIGIARAWADYRPITVRLTIDGVAIVRRTPFVFIGNGPYEDEGIDTGRRCSAGALTTGRLSIYVAPDCGRSELFGLSLRALAGRLNSRVQLEALQASSVTIETAFRHPLAAMDGELAQMKSPIECTVQGGALTTILPARP